MDGEGRHIDIDDFLTNQAAEIASRKRKGTPSSIIKTPGTEVELTAKGGFGVVHKKTAGKDLSRVGAPDAFMTSRPQRPDKIIQEKTGEEEQ